MHKSFCHQGNSVGPHFILYMDTGKSDLEYELALYVEFFQLPHFHQIVTSQDNLCGQSLAPRHDFAGGGGGGGSRW